MSRPLVIYLDQNKWIELARAIKNPSGNAETSEILERLRSAVKSGDAITPLSAAHYLETWHRDNWKSRHAVARLMGELSRFNAISPVQHLLCLEVEAFLLQRFRADCGCEAPDVRAQAIGHGVNHAFHSKTGRMRLVDWTADGTRDEGPASSWQKAQEIAAKIDAMPPEVYEWWSLMGLEDSMDKPGWEIRGEHRLGQERVDREHALAARFSENKEMRRRMNDLLVTEEIVEALDHLNHTAWWHGINLQRFKDQWMDERAEFGHALIDSLPTRACIVAMRRAKHKNPQWGWHQHDRTDMSALAAAVPYCDVVVTERQWAHVFRSSRLCERFGTKVTSRLGDLAPLLGS